MPSPEQIWVRTEDGCELQLPVDRKVKWARRWSPKRVLEKPAGELELGDYIQSYLGWSSITDVTR